MHGRREEEADDGGRDADRQVARVGERDRLGGHQEVAHDAPAEAGGDGDGQHPRDDELALDGEDRTAEPAQKHG